MNTDNTNTDKSHISATQSPNPQQEKMLPRFVQRALNMGLAHLSPSIVNKLAAARQFALQHQRLRVRLWQMAGGNASLNVSNSFFNQSESPANRSSRWEQLLAVVALLAGLWLAFYWHSTRYVDALEEVDVTVLSDEIPPEAFLDGELMTLAASISSAPNENGTAIGTATNNDGNNTNAAASDEAASDGELSPAQERKHER